VPATWTSNELQDVLAHATPIVRTFLHGLAVHGSGTTRELGVQHMAASIAQGYAKARGKEALFTSAKDGTTGKRVYTIEAKYRDDVARILSGVPTEAPAAAAQAPKRGPGRPRKVEAEPTAPKRGPGRPRKIDVAMESLVGTPTPAQTKSTRKAKRASDSIALPFGVIPDVNFWLQLVAMANEAVRRGKTIRFISDGRDVKIAIEGS
jgi:hypothetical protein